MRSLSILSIPALALTVMTASTALSTPASAEEGCPGGGRQVCVKYSCPGPITNPQCTCTEYKCVLDGGGSGSGSGSSAIHGGRRPTRLDGTGTYYGGGTKPPKNWGNIGTGIGVKSFRERNNNFGGGSGGFGKHK